MTKTPILIALALLAIASPRTLHSHTAAPEQEPQQRKEQQTPAPTRRIRLARDTVIDGIPCAPTGRAYAEFHQPDNRLAECPLSRDFTVRGHAFPAGTWVVLHPDGRLRLAWLSRNAPVGPTTCKGTGYKEWVTTFHDDGTLATCYLPRARTIDGIPCRAGTIWGEITGGVTVHFHPDGRLASCSLSRAITIEGERHRARTRLHLDQDGHVRQ
ncbi:MAG TPA: hypothetical protein VF039_03150 [Longimicrobiales bacterium]